MAENKRVIVVFSNESFIIISDCLGGGFKHFLFLPLFGEMIQFDSYLFGWVETTNQMGFPTVFFCFTPERSGVYFDPTDPLKLTSCKVKVSQRHVTTHLSNEKRAPCLFRVFLGMKSYSAILGDYNRPL